MAEQQLPPLDVVDQHGERITISSLANGTTVATLAAVLGVRRIAVDGALVDPARQVIEVDAIRRGARLSEETETPRIDEPGAGAGADELTSPTALIAVAVVAGPACSLPRQFGVGRFIVGRAPHADLRIDDPAVELHHGVLDVGADGDATFTQLAGAVPALVDGRPIDANTMLTPGTRVSLGSSIFEIRTASSAPATERSRPSGSIAAHVSDPWRRVVWRAPVESTSWEQTSIAPPAPVEPSPGPPMTSAVSAVTAAVGATIVAAVMDNLMLLVFAGVGAATSLVVWCVGAVIALRRRRQARAARRRDVERFRADLRALAAARRRHHERAHRRLDEVLAIALALRGEVWSRRAAGADDRRNENDGRNTSAMGVDAAAGTSLTAVVGEGTARWCPHVEGIDDDAELVAAVEAISRIHGTPIPVSIGAGDVVALHGPVGATRSLARSVIAQLATLHGPVDWRLLVLTRHTDRWEWTNWLPHGALDGRAVVPIDDTDRLATELAAVDRSQRTIVVTDDPALFTTRTGPLRRTLAATGAAAIVVVDADATVPAVCGRVLHIGATGRARWIGEAPHSDVADEIRCAGISVDLADRVARRLGCLVDPEVGDACGAGVPTSVSFDDVLPSTVPPAAATSVAATSITAVTPADVIARWRAAGKDPAPRAPIGWSGDGLVEIDLVRDGPHGLIAGTTGSGKSELLRSLVLSLALHTGPEQLNVVLIDYKGGSTFDACVDLPHTVGLVTDLDDGLAERALTSLTAELHRRERLLRAVGACDLTDYRSRVDVEPVARLVVVIDEFAALAKELPDFLSALVDIAQRGRSLGVHLLLATQRPAGVVSDDIRANTNLRLALRLHDRTDAVDVVGDAMPVSFPRDVPGRSALRLGPDELVVFQAARCTGPAMTGDGRGPSISRALPETSSAGLQAGRAVIDSDESDSDVLDGDEPSELDVAVRCVVAAAVEAGVAAPHRPWVEPLPFPLPVDDLASLGGGGSVGLVDDPEHQSRRALVWRPEDGSLVLVGSIGSGTTSALIALASATCRSLRPDELHLYVVDARGDDGLGALASLAHCGGVVRITEHERLHRLFARLAGEIDRRVSGVSDPTETAAILVMVDGWSALRTAVSDVDRVELNELVARVVTDGPGVGVVAIVTDGGSAAAASLAVADRWVFALDDPAVGRSFGVRRPVPHGRPGRLRIASSGLEAQFALGAAGLAEIVSRDLDDSGAPAIGVLPELVVETPGAVEWTSTRRGAAVDLVVGLGSDHLRPDGPTVPTGDPILVVGAARTGVTTAVERCAAAWCQARTGRVIRVDRRTPLDPESLVDDGDILLIVDDAHRIDDDARGTLAAVARGDHPRVTLLAGARADAVRSGYGHWTREVARARCGIVMANRGDPDGDVFGVSIPRRPLVRARPGLGWIVDGGALRQIQIASLHAATSRV